VRDLVEPSAPEIVGVRHPYDAVDAERLCFVPDRGVCRDDDGICGDGVSAGCLPDQEKRQVRRVPHPCGVRSHDECVRTLLLRSPGLLPVRDLDEDGDPVAFSNRLAQPAHRVGCY
jgi:hypothetical protein